MEGFLRARRSVAAFAAAIAAIIAVNCFAPRSAQAGNCGGGAVSVNSFGFVHPQFQSAGFVGVAAVPVQTFAAPVVFNPAAVNVQVNQRRSVFRPQRTNVQVNRFGGVRVNIR